MNREKYGKSPNYNRGQLIGERYKIKETLSTNGISCVVYTADDTKENKSVVLKVFKSAWLESKIEKEIQAMKGLDHPGVIKLIDFHFAEERGDFSYLVMNEIEQAQELFDYLQAKGGVMTD